MVKNTSLNSIKYHSITINKIEELDSKYSSGSSYFKVTASKSDGSIVVFNVGSAYLMGQLLGFGGLPYQAMLVLKVNSYGHHYLSFSKGGLRW